VLPEQIDLHKDDLFSWQILDESSRIIANEKTATCTLKRKTTMNCTKQLTSGN
jgi:hypothetical protein